eukprot:TRINITY_DN15591_c0_g1_i1.p3 TRINITY_DN15591_c0_g1~~TRINITY_DN15591_c0_g1_i1.p3  ORF type:complete len:176 (+),score=36.42 TRINITY_DN15591_c0_g1_i1:67-594(+)
MTVHLYELVGRGSPTAENPQPKLFRMRIFASDEVRARSLFWRFMSQLKKVKRANGELLSCRQVFEKRPSTVKNFAINIRYNSRTATHNMYKEYRDITLDGAVEQMFQEMAGRHRAPRDAIFITSTSVVPAKDCRRLHTQQFHDAKVKFPVVHRRPRAAFKKYRKTFAPARPSTVF